MIDNLIGEQIVMNAQSPRHFGHQSGNAVSEDFYEVFHHAVRDHLRETNDLQTASDDLIIRMATKPESVNIHDVMIAQQKAQISLDFTRTVLQKAVQAYQNITNLR